jgi:hypothetical protein
VPLCRRFTDESTVSNKAQSLIVEGAPKPAYPVRCYGLGFATDFLALPVRGTAIIWVILFVWMGTGCILNARRCHRLHCYISGPTFLLGAVVLGLLAAGLLGFGPYALNNIVGGTVVVALLSFIPEIWKKYA